MKVKNINQDLTKSADDYPDLDKQTVTLKNGKVVMLREMTGVDQKYLESLGDMSQTDSTCKMIARLTVADPAKGIDALSPKQVEKLSIINLTRLAELYAKMNSEDSEG